MLKFYYNLFREKRAFGPDKRFKRSLQKKLQTAWGELYPSRLMWYQMPALRYSMVALVVLVVVGSTGVGAYAYNSPEVTEGTRLYGVKRAIERIEEKVVERRAPEVQAKFYLKQIERREAEEKVMVRNGRVAEQIEKVEEKIERNEDRLEKVEQALAQPEIKAQVEKRLEKRREKIETKIKTRLIGGQADNKKLEKKQDLIINQKLYEESTSSVGGDSDSVGDGFASTSEEAIRQGKANGKSSWGRIKQRILNTGESSGEVRPKTGINSR